MQLDMFAEPAPAPAAPASRLEQAVEHGMAATIAPAIPQPPAIARADQDIGEFPGGLKPLRVVNPDWLEVKITIDEYMQARLTHAPMASTDYVLLDLLLQRGVRGKPTTDIGLQELYGNIDGPFVIRKMTEPGYAVTCRQGQRS